MKRKLDHVTIRPGLSVEVRKGEIYWCPHFPPLNRDEVLAEVRHEALMALSQYRLLRQLAEHPAWKRVGKRAPRAEETK